MWKSTLCVPRCKKEKNERFTFQPIKRLTESDEQIRMAKTKRSNRGRLTSEHDAPFIIHKDLVRTKAPAQMLIWHLSSVNQGGSFGGGYSGEIRNEMRALALEIHQALKQQNATTETPTEMVGCKGKEIWSPEPQFIGKETFFFSLLSAKQSSLFLFFYITIGFGKAPAWHRAKRISLTRPYFSRLSPVSLSVFILTPDLSLDCLRTQTYFRSSSPSLYFSGGEKRRPEIRLRSRAIRLTARSFLTWAKKYGHLAFLFVIDFLKHNFLT